MKTSVFSASLRLGGLILFCTFAGISQGRDYSRHVNPFFGTGGHGQLHMRERVAVAGGRLEVGPVRGGGYRVHASFPVPVAAPAGVGA